MPTPSPKQPGRALTKTDYKRLAADWIDQPTAEAAGLRRVSSQEAAEIICRRDTGTYAGIIFPYRWPGEEQSTQIRLRRDTPDIEIIGDQRKERDKYLTAPGTRNKLYWPPTDEAALQNAALPLIVTEGEKKGLALHRLASHEAAAPRFQAVALSGVANWQGRIGKAPTPNGGTTDEKGPIPCWHRIALKERQVVIVFDRDAATNPQVRYQRWKLAQYLGRQGAFVKLAEIPADCPHKGIDNLIAAEGPAAALQIIEAAKPADIDAELAALMKAAADLEDKELYYLLSRLLAGLSPLDYSARRSTIRKQLAERINITDLERMISERQKAAKEWRDKGRQAEALKYTGETYQATDGGLIMWRMGRTGEYAPVTLANFSAKIVADVVRDDGETKERALKLAASINGQAADLIITAAEFARMEWPIEHLGARANVMPNYRDHTRCAIQTISTHIETMTSYCHTGWNHDNGEPIYLHAGGAISKHGHVPNLHIELDRRLQKFRFPEPPTNGARREAIRAVLTGLNIAPDTITIPLFSAAFRAVLGNVQTSVFLTGQTGGGKSQLAALAQQMFGAELNAANLPASWDSTANALEALAHRAKDCLLVVDDFVPKGGAADLAKLNQTADRLLRAQGNASGRARMAADTSIRAPKVPRGMILSTGEDLPRGHSLRARLVVLELQPGDLQWKALTVAQANAAQGLYAAAMAAYIQHLAADLPAHRKHIETVTAELREGLASSGHKRTPDNLANLAAAFSSFLDFAAAHGAITAKERGMMAERCAAAVSALAEEQGKAQDHGEPCAAFLQAVVSAIASGAAHLADQHGTSTHLDKPQAWGWRKDAADPTIWRSQGTRIGWTHEDDVYLDPVAAYRVAQAQGIGEALQLTVSTLKRRMSQRGLLKSTDQARETTTIRRVLEGSRKDVLHLHATPSLTPEENPTNPTLTETSPSDRRGQARNVGFQSRVFKAIT